jgi:ABC-2 type transport system permease protein
VNLALQKLQIVFKRDLLLALRLRAGAASLLSLLFEIGGLYYLARSVGAGYRPEGIDYFAFATVGTAFVTFLLAGMSIFVNIIQEHRSNGALEVLLSAQAPPTQVLAFCAAPSLVRYGLSLVFTFLTAYAVLSGTPPNFDAFSGAVVFGLSLLLVASLGLIAAAAHIVFRKGQAVLWLSGSASWLLSGAMYPIDALPVPLQKLALLVPITYAIDAFRGAVLKGESLWALRSEVLSLCALIAVFGPASIWLFNVAVRVARRRGLLTVY